MYLSESIDSAEMVGFLPQVCRMTDRLQRFGYVLVADLKTGRTYPAHEFHHAAMEAAGEAAYDFENPQGEPTGIVLAGRDAQGEHDGRVCASAFSVAPRMDGEAVAMKTIIFGGTTEGREQAALALARGESVLVSVTSEYARQFLPEGAACHIGALDEAAMKAWIAAERPERVIDATHPFAVRATQTIRACADALHIPYVRIERAADRREDWRDAVTWAGNSEEAAALAALCAGNILLTTGSHTLSVYAKVIEPERLFVRVLPTHQALDLCAAAGMVQSHVIAMQGPFSRDFNAALYDQLRIRTMVSKDSGQPGGVADKVLPALERGIDVVMIERPKEDKR